jgi:hypothetical protein
VTVRSRTSPRRPVSIGSVRTASLAEAAFQALLAPALLPAARRVEAGGWVPGTVRATVVPFACMFIAAVAFGWAANDLCPEARRMVDVVACARR